jgi:hypothetical protein
MLIVRRNQAAANCPLDGGHRARLPPTGQAALPAAAAAAAATAAQQVGRRVCPCREGAIQVQFEQVAFIRPGRRDHQTAPHKRRRRATSKQP